MTNKEVMGELFRALFIYEYNNEIYGLKTSEYTTEIIEAEVKRILKHRNKLDTNKVYVYIRKCSNSILKKFNTLEEAVEYSDSYIGDLYILFNNKVLVPIRTVEKEVHLDKIYELAFG